MPTHIDIPLPEQPRVIESENNRATIEIAGLYPGYGVTLGNALRRVLLSSLPGAAVTVVAFRNVPHEFTTIPGVKETVLDITLNVKQLRLKLFSDEAQMIELNAKGEGKAIAKDLKVPAQVAIISEDLEIATLTEKKAELTMELTVERGIGYVPAEERKKEKMPIGSIAIDAIFTPVREVNFSVENMRVGGRTDYNRLRFDIETDGTITPEESLNWAVDILVGQFSGLLPEGFVGAGDAGSDALGSESLAVLTLPSGIIEKLEADGISVVGDLTKRTAKELEAIKGVGAKAVKDVEAALKKMEISLADEK